MTTTNTCPREREHVTAADALRVGTHLSTRMRLAICPIQAPCSCPAVIICMQQLMQGSGGDLAGRLELVVTKDHTLLL
eukprot:scaffold247526_cov16-Tisochrysis_lutea.AAC.3